MVKPDIDVIQHIYGRQTRFTLSVRSWNLPRDPTPSSRIASIHLRPHASNRTGAHYAYGVSPSSSSPPPPPLPLPSSSRSTPLVRWRPSSPPDRRAGAPSYTRPLPAVSSRSTPSRRRLPSSPPDRRAGSPFRTQPLPADRVLRPRPAADPERNPPAISSTMPSPPCVPSPSRYNTASYISLPYYLW